MDEIIKNRVPGIRTPAIAHPYSFKTKDSIVALTAFAVGFLFWEWNVLSYQAPTLGVFLFLMIVISITFFYMRGKGMKQSRLSYLTLALTLFSNCYFLVFDNTPLHFFVFVFVIFCYILWVMTVSGTSIMKKLNGFIIGDLLNQIFVVPFNNFTAMFRSFFTKDQTRKKSALSLAIGILVSIPILVIVVSLLAQADDGFQYLVDNTIAKLLDISFIHYVWEFLLGIPVACYFYGYIYGNHHKRKTDLIKYESLNDRFVKLHAIPMPAIFGPLVVLDLIYIIFFITLAGYLFSAFGGDLPASMTYAEYARKGFFELCAVSAINLAVIAFSYTGMKRKEGEYPRSLKILTAIMSVETVLLVATAMSKMLLYISSYGLTRLRVYTFWFMIVILFAFVLILIWHIKPFNLGKYAVIGCMVLFLALAFGNTDGQIAKYNINAYESGQIKELDIEMFTGLSDAAYPYVSSFAERTEDPKMKTEMTNIANYYKYDYFESEDGDGWQSANFDPWNKSIIWFNLQSFLAAK